jgi:pimeloyl-ACP methyl ester carboxylesterase
MESFTFIIGGYSSSKEMYYKLSEHLTAHKKEGVFIRYDGLEVIPLSDIKELEVSDMNRNRIIGFDFVSSVEEIIERIYKVIVTTLQTMKNREINLIGHSMGGVICTILADELRIKFNVKSLILVTPAFDLSYKAARYIVKPFIWTQRLLKPIIHLRYISIVPYKLLTSHSKFKDLLYYEGLIPCVTLLSLLSKINEVNLYEKAVNLAVRKINVHFIVAPKDIITRVDLHRLN